VTDTRLPDRWLMNPVMRELSDTDWRVYTWGLMQSNNQQTDGFIPASALVLLHPLGQHPDSYERLCERGLWTQVANGYQVNDWEETQTLSADLQRRRTNNRTRQQRKRDLDAASKVTDPSFSVPRDVPRDVLGEERLGKARIGKARQGQGSSSTETYDPATGEITGWVTVPIPGKDYEDGEPF
jgi:hypothetical protein